MPWRCWRSCCWSFFLPDSPSPSSISWSCLSGSKAVDWGKVSGRSVRTEWWPARGAARKTPQNPWSKWAGSGSWTLCTRSWAAPRCRTPTSWCPTKRATLRSRQRWASTPAWWSSSPWIRCTGTALWWGGRWRCSAPRWRRWWSRRTRLFPGTGSKWSRDSPCSRTPTVRTGRRWCWEALLRLGPSGQPRPGSPGNSW